MKNLYLLGLSEGGRLSAFSSDLPLQFCVEPFEYCPYSKSKHSVNVLFWCRIYIRRLLASAAEYALRKKAVMYFCSPFMVV